VYGIPSTKAAALTASPRSHIKEPWRKGATHLAVEGQIQLRPQHNWGSGTRLASAEGSRDSAVQVVVSTAPVLWALLLTDLPNWLAMALQDIGRIQYVVNNLQQTDEATSGMTQQA